MEIFVVILAFIVFVFVSALGIFVYFLPAFIAYKKGHANKNIILLVNFLLGWTFIGWAGCLVWACVDTDGATADRALRNFGGNKYEDLERLQKLKESGAITDAEFEVEKSKLLK